MAGQRIPGPIGTDMGPMTRIDSGTSARMVTPAPGGICAAPDQMLQGPAYTLDTHDLGWIDTVQAAAALWSALEQSWDHVARIVEQETGVVVDAILKGFVPAIGIALGALAASAALGAGAGAALGALAGGVGAVPGAVAGGQAGALLGMTVLEWLGLGFLVVEIGGALGHIHDYAGRATRRAVNSLFVFPHQRAAEITLAAQDYARAQAELIKAVLMGLVALLLKNSAVKSAGRAGTSVAELVAKLRVSRLGEGFAAWVEANWAQLVTNPRLQPTLPKSPGTPRTSQALTPSQLARRGAIDPPAAPAISPVTAAKPFPLSQAAIDKIVATPKGSRPDPSSYLPANYIEGHLAKFDRGATRFMTRGNLDKYGIAQQDGTSFVMTRAEADAMLRSTGGNKRAMEQALGLPDNFLDTYELVRIDIPNPRALNLRLPSGNEAGANALWIPGGRLPTGNLEAVIDPGGLTPGSYSTTALTF